MHANLLASKFHGFYEKTVKKLDTSVKKFSQNSRGHFFDWFLYDKIYWHRSCKKKYNQR